MTAPAARSSSGREGAVGRGRGIFERGISLLSIAVVLVVAVPLILMIIRISGDAGILGSAQRAFSLPGLPRVLLNTVMVICASTVLAVCLACMLAWFNERTNARMGWVSDVLPVIPLLVPSIAGAIGWVLLASPTAGFINVALKQLAEPIGVSPPVLSIFSWPGLIFVYTLYMVPQLYLSVAGSLRNLDPALEEAARISGAGQLRVLTTITIPAIRPAILSGALLALVYGIALFSVPLIIGTQARIGVLTVEIVRLLTFTFPPRLGEAIILSLLVGLVLAMVWWSNVRLVKRGAFATIGGKSGSKGQAIELSGLMRFSARAFMLAFLLASSVLPVLALLLVSVQGFWSGRFFVPLTLDNYREVFQSGTQTFIGLRNSLLLAILAATLAVLIAVLVAHRIADHSSRILGPLVDGVTKLPGTLSHMVVAVALLAAFAGPPFQLSGTLLLLILAYVVLYLPQASVSAQSARSLVSQELVEASLVSGRGPGATLIRIILPLTRIGIVAGWTFVFVLVIGDITASAILASPRSPVVGFVIMTLFQNGTYPTLAALGVVISAVSSMVVISTLLILGRRGFHQV